MAKCEATHGDCDVKSCRCQNQMVSVREMGDDYEDYEDGPDDDDEEKKGTRRSARKSAEVRADESKVRTKTVGGKGTNAAHDGGSPEGKARSVPNTHFVWRAAATPTLRAR